MMQVYPANAAERLEFDKIQNILLSYCRTDTARERVGGLRFMSRAEVIDKALRQTAEFKNTLSAADNYFPADFTRNITKELKLLAVTGAVLAGEQLVAMQALAITIRDILAWFKNHEGIFPHLQALAEKIQYEKGIAQIVSSVLDESGVVKDNASRE